MQSIATVFQHGQPGELAQKICLCWARSSQGHGVLCEHSRCCDILTLLVLLLQGGGPALLAMRHQR